MKHNLVMRKLFILDFILFNAIVFEHIFDLRRNLMLNTGSTEGRQRETPSCEFYPVLLSYFILEIYFNITLHLRTLRTIKILRTKNAISYICIYK